MAPKVPQRVALGLTLGRELDALVALRWLELTRAGDLSHLARAIAQLTRHLNQQTGPQVILDRELLEELHGICLDALANWWPGPVFNGRASWTVQARNNVVQQAFGKPERWDSLLFWDSDQLPPFRVPGPIHGHQVEWEGGTFCEYVGAIHKEPVVVFLYYNRDSSWLWSDPEQKTILMHGPHEPVAYVRRADGGYRYLNLGEMLPLLKERGRYRIGGGGTGAMLIQKRVLTALAELKRPRALFESPQDLAGELVESLRQDPADTSALSRLLDLLQSRPVFEAPTMGPGQTQGLAAVGDQPRQASYTGMQWTEDLFFCEEVTQRLGLEIWLDTCAENAHRADNWVYSPEYLRHRGYAGEPPPPVPRGTAPRALSLPLAGSGGRTESGIILPIRKP